MFVDSGLRVGDQSLHYNVHDSKWKHDWLFEKVTFYKVLYQICYFTNILGSMTATGI